MYIYIHVHYTSCFLPGNPATPCPCATKNNSTKVQKGTKRMRTFNQWEAAYIYCNKQCLLYLENMDAW